METEAGSVISLVNYFNALSGEYGPLIQALNWICSLLIAALITVPGYRGLKKISPRLFEQQADRIDDLVEQTAAAKQDALRMKSESRTKINAKQKVLRELKKEYAAAAEKLERAREGFESPERHMWRRRPFSPPDDYHTQMRRSKPVILLANMKGGVGKTTVAANLVGYFEVQHSERVLAIDLDYQGSLSATLMEDSREKDDAPARVLLEGISSPEEILGLSSPVRHSVTDSRLIQCQSQFSNVENAMMLKWLIGDREDDIRYNIARFIQSDFIQENFDRVIIDAPPRLTTGFVNALCASTHVFIPTILDQTSIDGVDTFLQDIGDMRGELFPELQVAGIIGTMKPRNGALTKHEELAVREIQRIVSNHLNNDQLFMQDAIIPRLAELSNNAGREFMYPRSGAVQKIFKPLGDIVHQRTTHIGGYDGNTHPHAPAPSV